MEMKCKISRLDKLAGFLVGLASLTEAVDTVELDFSLISD